MTFVVAKQFGERILIAADTMISVTSETKTVDDRAPRPDIIPGRLKAVVLAPNITAAYAGWADPGQSAIRAAKQALAEGGGIHAVELILRNASAKHMGELEFILASHAQGPSLRRIWNGIISSNLPRVAIGTRALETRLGQHEAAAPLRPLPWRSDEEDAFIEGVGQLFREVQVTESVGGFHFLLEASPRGHGYLSRTDVTAWDRVWGGIPVSEGQLADRRSGMTEWAYQVSPSRWHGVGVAGVIVLNAGVGYLYSPLTEDEAVPWRFTPPVTQDDQCRILELFHHIIETAANQVGGGVDLLPLQRRIHPPSEVELAAMQALAAAARLPTTIEVQARELWISVTTETAGRSMGVDFAFLGDDPVGLVGTVMERLGAGLQP